MSENILKVKQILDIEDNILDSYLEFCELNITNKILDFCNIETIPERLNVLIQEFLMEQYNLNKNGIGEGKVYATSATDGKQKVDFGTTGGASSMSKNVDQFMNRNMSTLVAYRELRWK